MPRKSRGPGRSPGTAPSFRRRPAVDNDRARRKPAVIHRRQHRTSAVLARLGPPSTSRSRRRHQLSVLRGTPARADAWLRPLRSSSPKTCRISAVDRRSYAKFHRVEGGVAVPKPKARRSRVERNPESAWIVVEDTHPPLVTPEIWNRARRIMKGRSGLTASGETLRASRLNSPFLLSGLVACRRCGATWQGYKTIKGRRKAQAERVETFYYCCGSYVRKGNKGCPRALVPKEEFEAVVLEAVTDEMTQFVKTGGAPILEALVLKEANDGIGATSEAAIREKLAADTRRMQDLVACLTPALAPTLEPRIVELQARIDALSADLETLRKNRLSPRDAVRAVGAFVEDVRAISRLLATATVAERRDVLRAFISKITLDPEKGTAVVAMHGIPKLAAWNRGPAEGAAVNGESPGSCDPRLLLSMAGAGHPDVERTLPVRVHRPGALQGGFRRSA